MARSDALVHESLELLLDTICNVFGAVLFIAMLVVTLVNPDATEQTDVGNIEVEMAATEAQVKTMQLEIGRLQSVLAQQKNLKQKYGSPQSQTLAANISEESRQAAQAAEDRSSQLSNLLETDQENMEIRRKIRLENDELKRVKQLAAQISRRLSDQVKARGRLAKTPKTVRLRTLAIGTMLKGGVWYCLTKPNRQGGIEINTSDCTAVANGTLKTLKPRPGAGVAIRNTQAPIRPFQPADPQKHHFTLFVYKDSCREFRPVREALSEAGFRVELILMEDDEFPQFGPGGSGDRWGA